MQRKKGRWGEGTYVLGCSSVEEHFCNIWGPGFPRQHPEEHLMLQMKEDHWRPVLRGCILSQASGSCFLTPWSQLLCTTACPCMLKPGAPRNRSFFKFSLSALCHGDEKTAKLFSSWQLSRPFLSGFLFSLIFVWLAMSHSDFSFMCFFKHIFVGEKGW